MGIVGIVALQIVTFRNVFETNMSSSPVLLVILTPFVSHM